MSHAKDYAPPKVTGESSVSQLSPDAACFIPSTCNSNVSTNLNEIQPYFNDYVWPNSETLDPSLYVRNLESCTLGQLQAGSNIPPSFQFNHYPSALKLDYWGVTFQEIGRTSPDLVHDGFYPSAAVSWTDPSSLQQNSVPIATSPFVQLNDFRDFNRNFSDVANSRTSDVKNGESGATAEKGKIIHPKRKKKKQNALKNPEVSSSDSKQSDDLAVKAGKPLGKESQNTGTVVSDGVDISASEPRKYRNNSSQTDFSDELSRLTLNERPNTLYSVAKNSEFTQKCFASAFPTTAAVISDTVPVSTSQVMDYRLALTSNPSRTVDRIVHPATSNLKSGPTVAQRGSNKTLEGINKSSFDHSSIRSQSGRRKSTGISTSDRAKDGSSQDRQKMKAKHNGQSNNINKKVVKDEQLLERLKTKEEGLDANDHASSATRKLKSSVGEAKAGMPSNASRCKTKNSSLTQDEKSRSSSQKNQRVRSVSSGTKLSGVSRSTSRGHQKVVKSDFAPVFHQAPESSQRDGTRDEEGMGFSLENSTTQPQDSESTPGEAKGKRKHRKRRKKVGAKDGKTGDEVTSAASDFLLDSSKSAELNALPNFDDSEFPNLTDVQDSKNEVVSGPIKYSDILSGRVKMPFYPQHISTPRKISSAKKQEDNDGLSSPDDADDDDVIPDDVIPQSSGLLMPNKATARSASQPPRPTPKKPGEKKAVGAGKKTKEPITLNIFDMITVKTKSKKTAKELDKNPVKFGTKPGKTQGSKAGNLLDSSAVHTRRGKEREVPKPKKPSVLRKVILKERESRRQKFLQECMAGNMGDPTVDTTPFDDELCGEPDGGEADGGEPDAGERRHASAPASASTCRVASVSPCARSSIVSPDVSTDVKVPDAQKELLQSLIHSRRFREYCTQVLSPDINSCCTALLTELVRFQDRLYHKDPNKAKLKRRICLGLREVTKHLKGGKIKCAIISPNLERVQAKGGLDEALYSIINLCQEQNVPFVFALSRKQLGRACCKIVPVSVVGVFSYAGAEEHFSKLKDLTEKARDSYREMVSTLKSELEASVPEAANDNIAARSDDSEHLNDLSHAHDLLTSKEHIGCDSNNQSEDNDAIGLKCSNTEYGGDVTSYVDSPTLLPSSSSFTTII